MRDIILSDVRLFTKAVELGGLAQAADVLRVPKASASRQLQRLESRLGHLLLYRGGTRFSLTEEGREFLLPAQNVLKTLDQAVSELFSDGDSLTGQLRIAVPNYFGRDLLTPHLPAFMAAHPHLEIVVTSGAQEVDLLRDEADIAVRSSRLGCDDLIARSLKNEPMVLCAAPSYLTMHPEIDKPQKLESHFFLTTESEIRGQKREITIQARNEIYRIRVAGVFRASDPEFLLDLALAGNGVALISLALAQGGMKNGNLVRVIPDLELAPQELNLMYLPERRNAPKIRIFVDYLLSAFNRS